MEHNTEFQTRTKSGTVSDNDQVLSGVVDIKEESAETSLVLDGNLVNKSINMQNAALPIFDVKEEPLDQNWVISGLNKNNQDAAMFENLEIKREISDEESYTVYITNDENVLSGKEKEQLSAQDTCTEPVETSSPRNIKSEDEEVLSSDYSKSSHVLRKENQVEIEILENNISTLNDHKNNTETELDLSQAQQLEPNVRLRTKMFRNEKDEPNKSTSTFVNDDITSKSESEEKQKIIGRPMHNYIVYHTLKYDQQVYTCSACRTKFVDSSAYHKHTKICKVVTATFYKNVTNTTKSPKTNVNLSSLKTGSLTNQNHEEPSTSNKTLMLILKPQTMDEVKKDLHNKSMSLQETKLSSATAVDGKVSVNPCMPAGRKSPTSLHVKGSDIKVKTPPDIRVLSFLIVHPPVDNSQGAAGNIPHVGNIQGIVGHQRSTSGHIQGTVGVQGIVGHQQSPSGHIQGTVGNHDKTPGNQHLANKSFGRVNQLTKQSAYMIKCLYCLKPISLVKYEEHLQSHLDCISDVHKSETEMVENIGLLFLHFAKCDLSFSVRKCKSEMCHYIFLSDSLAEKHFVSHHFQQTQSGSNEKMEEELHDPKILENVCNNQLECFKSPRLLQNRETTPKTMTQVKNKIVFEPQTSPRQVQKRKRELDVVDDPRKYQKIKELLSQPCELKNSSYVMCNMPRCRGIFDSIVKLQTHIQYAHGIRNTRTVGQEMAHGIKSTGIVRQEMAHGIKSTLTVGQEMAHGIESTGIVGQEMAHEIKITGIVGQEMAHGIKSTGIVGQEMAHRIKSTGIVGQEMAHGIKSSGIVGQEMAHGIKITGIVGQEMEPKSGQNNNFNYFLWPQSTCNKTFDCTEKLNAHIQVARVLKNTEVDKQIFEGQSRFRTYFVCSQDNCVEMFESMDNLKSHEKVAHSIRSTESFNI